jgi:3-phenylpropionate/trans-cinnamate dioxygenase ferredoxin subunit
MRHVVCPVGELPAGERRIVNIGRRSIGVFHVGDRFYAVRNRCPHQGGPLCVGHILGDAVADGPGLAAVSDNPLRIACPWHGWEYDLATGQSFLGPSDPGVKSYGVALEAGGALVAEVKDQQVKLVPGPYTAETFEVKVEDDYVVLEV